MGLFDNKKLKDENKALREALQKIIEQKTPSANATVTRMVNIAEQTLKDFELVS